MSDNSVFVFALLLGGFLGGAGVYHFQDLDCMPVQINSCCEELDKYIVVDDNLRKYLTREDLHPDQTIVGYSKWLEQKVATYEVYMGENNLPVPAY